MAIYDVNGAEIGGYNPAHTASESIAAFMAEVNKKAASIGMSSSNFLRAAGDSSTAQTTAKDMALLTLIASGYKELAEVWGKNSYTINRRGGTSVTVNTTVTSSALEDYYPILGGKTGSYAGARALACLCEVDGKQVAGYIAGTSTDAARFTAMKQLMDIAATVLAGGTNSATVTDATCAVALEVPTYFPMSYEQQTPSTLYAQADTTSIAPASTAKIITAITMLDWVENVNDLFTFISSDAIGGSGAVFSTGDVISFKDALYAMMLPSSNMTAQAVARVIGNRILELS